MTYVASLSAELGCVGIDGRLRRRIVAEIEDHLACDPDAKLGAPAELANRFADELGTARARRGAYAAFAALAVAAAAVAVSWVGSKSTGLAWPRVHPPSRLAADLGFALVAVGSQVALVAGVLGALRAFRLRHDVAVPRTEATVIGHRAVVALVAGIATMAGLVLVTLELHGGQPHWWMPATLAGASLAVCVLLAASLVVRAALRVRPVGDGEAGDLFADLGALTPSPLRGRPWILALAVAATVAVAITIGGVVQSDGYDGALRGLADGLACLAGFALLGRYLGLRAADA